MKGSATKVDEFVGARVRERRKQLGLSQERLADTLGVSFQQVQKYEIGINRVAAGRLYDISNSLDVDIGYFFKGVEKATARKKSKPKSKSKSTRKSPTRRRSRR